MPSDMGTSPDRKPTRRRRPEGTWTLRSSATSLGTRSHRDQDPHLLLSGLVDGGARPRLDQIIVTRSGQAHEGASGKGQDVVGVHVCRGGCLRGGNQVAGLECHRHRIDQAYGHKGTAKPPPSPKKKWAVPDRKRVPVFHRLSPNNSAIRQGTGPLLVCVCTFPPSTSS